VATDDFEEVNSLVDLLAESEGNNGRLVSSKIVSFTWGKIPLINFLDFFEPVTFELVHHVSHSMVVRDTFLKTAQYGIFGVFLS